VWVADGVADGASGVLVVVGVAVPAGTVLVADGVAVGASGVWVDVGVTVGVSDAAQAATLTSST